MRLGAVDKTVLMNVLIVHSICITNKTTSAQKRSKHSRHTHNRWILNLGARLMLTETREDMNAIRPMYVHSIRK